MTKIIRKYDKSKQPKTSPLYPYKSRLEKALHTGPLSQYEYEPKGSKVAYIVGHDYYPDFIHPNQPKVLVEAKGFMQNGSSDCSKYVAIAKCNPDYEIVFIFSDSKAKAYPQCRRRKDGTILSLAEWCVKSGFLYWDTHNVPNELICGQWSVTDLRILKENK